MIPPTTARKISLAANFGALISPIVLYGAGLYDPPESDGYVCGLYILLPLAVDFLVAGGFALVGLVAGGIRFWKQPIPRSLTDKVEGVASSAPFVLVVLFAVSFWWLGG